MLQWAPKVLRQSALFEYLGQILPLTPSILPPPPETMLYLLSARLASFEYNIEKGGGGVVQKRQQIKGKKTGILN